MNTNTDRAKDNASLPDSRGRRRFLATHNAVAATLAGGLTELGDEGREPACRCLTDAHVKSGAQDFPARPLSGTGSTLTPLESLTASYGLPHCTLNAPFWRSDDRS